MSDTEMGDTDAEQAKRAEQQESVRRLREADLRAVMATGSGRRLVWRLIDDAAGTFGGTYTGEALSGAYGEGRRSIGIALMAEAQRVARVDYVRMLAESLEARTTAEAQKATPSG